MTVGRRQFLNSAAKAAALATFVSATSSASAKPFTPAAGPRARVMIVNDLCGDLDGLFATVHALLSPSTQVCGIIGTSPGVGRGNGKDSAVVADEILKVMGLTSSIKVYEGAATRLTAVTAPDRSPGVQAIIDEAMRTDTKLPLYITVGGGLTEVASALLIEPRIADKFTLVWIGGGPYPAGGKSEYNFNIDRIAAQYVFNDTSVALWQIPSSAYAQCQVSDTELQAFVAPYGTIGQWLYGKVVEAGGKLAKDYSVNTGETWVLGDSPLVLLTALTSWVPSGFGRVRLYEHTSSQFDEPFAPRLKPDGSYEARDAGRRIRVFTRLDTRLMLGDLFVKLRMNYGA